MEKKKILIVDDDPDFVMSVRSILEKADYEVEEACNGQEGLESVARALPDLIIMDVMMPVMNGHVACKKLKSDPRTTDIPIVLLTAVADKVTSSSYTRGDILDSAADDYIPKPVTPRDLLEAVKSYL